MYGDKWPRGKHAVGALDRPPSRSAPSWPDDGALRPGRILVPGVYGPAKEEWAVYGMSTQDLDAANLAGDPFDPPRVGAQGTCSGSPRARSRPHRGQLKDCGQAEAAFYLVILGGWRFYASVFGFSLSSSRSPRSACCAGRAALRPRFPRRPRRWTAPAPRGSARTSRSRATPSPRSGAARRARRRIVDASGLVVAPGFIDIHTHARRGHLRGADRRQLHAPGRDDDLRGPGRRLAGAARAVPRQRRGDEDLAQLRHVRRPGLGPRGR